MEHWPKDTKYPCLACCTCICLLGGKPLARVFAPGWLVIVGGVVWVQMGRTPLFFATKAEVVQLLTAADAAVNHVCQVRCLGVTIA